jgi:hypothetical protein
MGNWQGTARVALEAGRAGGGMAYQEAGAEPRAGLALRESCLRRPSRSLVSAERVDEDGVHGRYIAGGERHLARTPRNFGRGRCAAAAGWDDRGGTWLRLDGWIKEGWNRVFHFI